MKKPASANGLAIRGRRHRPMTAPAAGDATFRTIGAARRRPIMKSRQREPAQRKPASLDSQWVLSMAMRTGGTRHQSATVDRTAIAAQSGYRLTGRARPQHLGAKDHT